MFCSNEVKISHLLCIHIRETSKFVSDINCGKVCYLDLIPYEWALNSVPTCEPNSWSCMMEAHMEW
jgi:hypothetical protein